VGQVDVLQVHGHVGGQSPEVIVAQVERAQVGQRVVDEDGPLQLVVGEVKQPQVPLVDCVVLVQQLEAVGGDVQLPEGAGQAGGQVAQPVVRQVQEAEVGVGGQLAVQVVKSVVGQVEGARVVLQTVGKLPQASPRAVNLPVAAAAGAHGGAHGEDMWPQQQHEQELQKGLVRGQLR